MKTNAATQVEPEYPPLARDALGNLISFPDKTAAWRICRETSGRPREIKGPDKQPVRFPLTTTTEELIDLCGADTYRVYALDEVGNDLGHITTICAEHGRELRNASDGESQLIAALRPAAAASDLRFALEALTQIARINGEALRSVSQAQADWVKAIAMAKGLPRNVAFPHAATAADDDEEDDEPAEPPPVATQPSGIETFLGAVGPLMPELYKMWRGEAKGGSGMTHLARIQAQLDKKERMLLDLLLSDAENGEAVASELAEQSVEAVVARIRSEAAKVAPRNSSSSEQRAEPGLDSKQPEKQLTEKAVAVMKLIDPSLRLRLMRLAPAIQARRDQPEVKQLAETLLPMSVEEAAQWIADNFDDLEKRFAS